MNKSSLFQTKLPMLCVLLWCASVVYAQTVQSPNGKCQVHFNLQRGKPVATLEVDGASVPQSFPLGLQLVGESPSLQQDFVVKSVQMDAPSSSAPYNEMAVELLQRTTAREMVLRMRVSNDSVCVCYEIPQQNTMPTFKVRIAERIIELRSPALTPWEKLYETRDLKQERPSFWKRLKNWFTRKEK